MPIQDIQMFVRQAKMRGRDIVVFNGPDEQFVGGRLIGAEGGIGGTYGVMPEVYIRLNELIKKGEFEKARELQDAANEVTYTMCSAKGNMYAVAKAVLKKRMGIDLGGVRAPLLNLEEGDEKIVEKAFELVEKALSL